MKTHTFPRSINFSSPAQQTWQGFISSSPLSTCLPFLSFLSLPSSQFLVSSPLSFAHHHIISPPAFTHSSPPPNIFFFFTLIFVYIRYYRQASYGVSIEYNYHSKQRLIYLYTNVISLISIAIKHLFHYVCVTSLLECLHQVWALCKAETFTHPNTFIVSCKN